jgi:hypothetical protein
MAYTILAGNTNVVCGITSTTNDIMQVSHRMSHPIQRMFVCEKKGLEDLPTGNASIILKLHIQNKFNNRETEKNINSDVKNILLG